MYKGKQHPRSLEGFKSLFDTLYPPLCLFANKYLNDMDTAEDIVQEVFIKVWEQDIQYINFYAAKSFFYKSVRNRCLDYLKSKYHRSVIQSPDIDFEKIVTEEFFLTQLTIIDTYSQLETAIKQLPTKCERIIRLSLNEYTIKEIADELAISKNTVKSQKRIAYEKLRHSLGSLLNIF
ncbi:RNA polymerase sigma-70 factor [Subsaximicrobium wynnwilliamsii]|uniref:RNA polymerase sigma-70 factor n=1 Tax=Subsaximicrobium wynnwilliamsii TaxID=291179 RepID=A0A5C6ZE63_9FLAO|nr:RNA polymerase sigma-70 factor [Subsaximicrobium wynnwilliamsii]TXD81180.1 RNA polymerase sigma-70 factor [Subsaximicrobium wynnwilliamsii]TXD86997.1 RNA polymerase sigma-70 factor [Subsaximicrobium wynnwilliamsii]TXE00650.1 RNA polymerase sigma-70 factor [Subsaximicrobium wynnwilliamsii]